MSRKKKSEEPKMTGYRHSVSHDRGFRITCEDFNYIFAKFTGMFYELTPDQTLLYYHLHREYGRYVVGDYLRDVENLSHPENVDKDLEELIRVGLVEKRPDRSDEYRIAKENAWAGDQSWIEKHGAEIIFRPTQKDNPLI